MAPVGGTTVTPTSTNLALEPGTIAPEDMIKSVKSGFYVTEMIGHGANLVTGEYSRGAAGFWIENGELNLSRVRGDARVQPHRHVPVDDAGQRHRPHLFDGVPDHDDREHDARRPIGGGG